MPNAKRRRPFQPPSGVEAANALPLDDFITSYLPPHEPCWTTYSVPSTPPTTLTLALTSAPNLSKAELQQCFSLIVRSSKFDYQHSILGWHPVKKRQEMKLLDLKYLLVRGSSSTSPSDPVVGFLSFMPTYEDEVSCCYIYEIHLVPELRGSGLGRHLVGMVEAVARNVGAEKVMLTCFVSNRGARAFYEKLGFEVEEVIEGRKLRGAKREEVDESGYLIMGKHVGLTAQDDDVERGQMGDA